MKRNPRGFVHIVLVYSVAHPGFRDAVSGLRILNNYTAIIRLYLILTAPYFCNSAIRAQQANYKTDYSNRSKNNHG